MRSLVLACALLVTSVLSGCAAVDSTVIAVLVADREAQVQQSLDFERIEGRVEATCNGCTVEVYDAAGDVGTQDEQFDRVLEESADLVILQPVDVERAESLVQAAGEVPVLAYADLVPGADWFVGMSTPPTAIDDVDNDLEAAREVISRDRKSFDFVRAGEMSQRAADVAVAVLADEPVEESAGEPVEHEGVSSWLVEPVPVTVNDLTTVVVASGAMSLAELCEGATARRCDRIGLI